MGTNARMAIMGDRSPTAATTNPSVAAMLYAGATEAVAMTVLDISPSAPDFSPLSRGCSADATASLAVAMPTPSEIRPVTNRITYLMRGYIVGCTRDQTNLASRTRGSRTTVLARI